MWLERGGLLGRAVAAARERAAGLWKITLQRRHGRDDGGLRRRVPDGPAGGRFVFPWMPGCDNGNFSTDAYLSMAIGRASGFFVGTDVAYLGGDGNFLRPVVGDGDFDSDVLGIVKAGTSAGLGYCAFSRSRT